MTPPLQGWRVLVPRPAGRGAELIDELVRAGADITAVPLISICPPPDTGALDLALIALAAGDFSWVGCTSVNAVHAVTERAGTLGLTPPVPADTRVAAVGRATARALTDAGVPVDLVPGDGGSAAALAGVWPRAHPGDAVLLPRSDLAAPTLPSALQAAGYRVEAITAYRTVVESVTGDVAAGLRAGAFDAVLLTSPSVVAALADVKLAPVTVVGAIGEPTARAARAAGHRVDFTAAVPSAAALVDGLVAGGHHHERRVDK